MSQRPQPALQHCHPGNNCLGFSRVNPSGGGKKAGNSLDSNEIHPERLTDNMFAEQQQSVPLRPREPHSAMIYSVSYINLSLDSDYSS